MPIVAIGMEGTKRTHLTGVKAQRARGGFITMPSLAICNGGFDVGPLACLESCLDARQKSTGFQYSGATFMDLAQIILEGVY